MFRKPTYLLCLLSACIGTDHLDDPEDPGFMVNTEAVSLIVGDSFQVEAVYHYNMFTPVPDAPLVWQSSREEVATVFEGLVRAIGPGQSVITVRHPDKAEAIVRVTVVANSSDVSRVEVIAPSNHMGVGTSLQLHARAYDLDGEELTDVSVIWQSDDTEVVSITNTGVATAHRDGTARITAEVDGIVSAPLVLMAGDGEALTGTFQSANGYHASGQAFLQKNDQNQLILSFSADFQTSFAAGTFVYLSNSIVGNQVQNLGVEIAEVKSNGAQSFNISARHPQVQVDDYSHVVLLCKPFQITFGFAEMK